MGRRPEFVEVAAKLDKSTSAVYALLLVQWLELLPMQQRVVVEHRFGLHGQGRRTLEEVGAMLGVTRERVRQVQLAALARLKEISQREGIMEAPFME